MKKEAFQATATMIGTVIGAGVLGIPYVIAKAGFLVGMLNIFVIGLVVLLLYLYLGEVALRTKGFHQLTGYAERYLGSKGKALMTFAMVFGTYGAMVAYIIGEGQALSAIFGGSPVLYSIGFFVVASTIIYLGLKEVAKSESYMVPLMIIVIGLVGVLSYKHLDFANYSGEFNVYNLFLPYGVVLFAFLGASAVPEMEQILVKKEQHLKRAILIGMLVPMVVYLVFTVVVIGVTGSYTTEVATVGLGNIMGEQMVLIGNLFAVFAMATSCLSLGLALYQMYDYDYGINKNLSWALTCIVPLAVAMSGLTSFVRAIGLSGVIAGGVEGVLIVLMAIKAKSLGNRKPEYSVPIPLIISSLLVAVFVFGAAYYFWSSL